MESDLWETSPQSEEPNGGHGVSSLSIAVDGCARKFQINALQPFLYSVNVDHNSLWVDLKYIFKFGKHHYIDDMVNDISKFNIPLSTSALAAFIHMNEVKHTLLTNTSGVIMLSCPFL